MRSLAPIIAILLFATLSIAVEAHAKPIGPNATETKPKPKRATKVEELDALKLLLVQTEAREQDAIRSAAKDRYEVAEKRLQILQEEYRVILDKFLRKYGIDPSAGDGFDPKTLEIKWADEKKTPAAGAK